MAFTKGSKPLAGYPQPIGKKIQVIMDRTGPSSYAAFTSPATGGDVLKASDISQGGFDSVEVGIDTTGQITGVAVFNKGGYQNAVPSVIIVYTSLVTATLGGQAQTAGSQIAATTDLSTFSWRVRAQVV